jgi:hypothetical protein
MELKDIVNYGPFGVLPRLAVKEYEGRKQDKMEAEEKRRMEEQAAAEQAAAQGMKKGGRVKASSASKRADGCATKGKTRGRMV